MGLLYHETQMECPVCLDTCSITKKLRCGHSFCKSCTKEWYLKTECPTCPLCREKMIFDGMLNYKSKHVDDDDVFQNIFNQFMDWYTEDGIDQSYIIMDELRIVQDTIYVMKNVYDIDDDDIYTLVMIDGRICSRRKIKYEYPQKHVPKTPVTHPKSGKHQTRWRSKR